MATIKSFTDIEQSKILAKILPIESADMHWSRCTITDFGEGALKVSYAVEPCNISKFRNTKEDIPCWSLAALLRVLPNPSLHKTFIGWRCDTYNDNCTKGQLGDTKDSPIDACVDMIEKLHKMKML